MMGGFDWHAASVLLSAFDRSWAGYRVNNNTHRVDRRRGARCEIRASPQGAPFSISIALTTESRSTKATAGWDRMKSSVSSENLPAYPLKSAMSMWCDTCSTTSLNRPRLEMRSLIRRSTWPTWKGSLWPWPSFMTTMYELGMMCDSLGSSEMELMPRSEAASSPNTLGGVYRGARWLLLDSA